MRILKVPGLSVAVFEEFEMVWANSYGLADASTVLKPTTSLQAASISKTVNALAVLLFAHEGRLKLDVPVNEYLKDWRVPEDALTRDSKVTVARLLSHTAGTSVQGFPGYARGKPLPTLAQLLDGLPPSNTPPVRVQQKPGTAYEYSGGGTSIVQLVIEEVSERPYPDVMNQYVLLPLGMTNSFFEPPLGSRRRAGRGS